MTVVSRYPETIDRNVAERITQRRTELGMTMDDLGTATGYTQQRIHKFESGLTRICAGQLFTLAEALGYSLADHPLFKVGARRAPVAGPTSPHTRARLNRALDRMTPDARRRLLHVAEALANPPEQNP